MRLLLAEYLLDVLTYLLSEQILQLLTYSIAFCKLSRHFLRVITLPDQYILTHPLRNLDSKGEDLFTSAYVRMGQRAFALDLGLTLVLLAVRVARVRFSQQLGRFLMLQRILSVVLLLASSDLVSTAIWQVREIVDVV